MFRGQLMTKKVSPIDMGGLHECSSLVAAVPKDMGGHHDCSSLVAAAPKHMQTAAAAAIAAKSSFHRPLGDNTANLRLLTGLQALLGTKQPLYWLLQPMQLLNKPHRSNHRLPPHWAQKFLQRCRAFLQVILLVLYLPSSDRSSTSDFGPC